ncbi:MAG TPA: penicillin-binding protein, partial [Roseiarcus sp.]|nr:penicillin-binding protein [Roseiarcus sp.]
GTSQEWRDAWFVGYTSYLVAGVWLGNDDGAPTKKVSGGNLPVEIWSRFMKAAHQGVPIAALPSGVWRNADAPAAEPAPLAPPAPPPEAVGAPLTIGRGGDAASGAPAAPVKRALAPAVSDAPVPPAPIPNVDNYAPAAPQARDKNLLNKLFGAI